MGDPKVLLPLFLVLTVGLLAAVVVTGLKGRVKPHIVLVVATLASLVITIYFAERLGELYDLAGAGRITEVHLLLAKIATLGFLAPAASGLMTLKQRRHKPLHFRLAMLSLALTVAAAVTGAWMVLASEPLAPHP
jgi:uncharacterized membrane protein